MSRRQRAVLAASAALGLVLGATVVGPRLWPVVEHLDAARAGVVLDRLLGERDAALMARDADALALVSVPGSDLARHDAGLVAALREAGTALVGLRTVVTEVRTLETGAEGTVVEAVLGQGPHVRVVDGTREEVGALAPACSRIVLERVDRTRSSWRLVSSAACDAPPGTARGP